MLEGLYLGFFRFIFVPEADGVVLPGWKNKIFKHETFKEILHSYSCKLKGKVSCSGCYFMYRCPYAYMYCDIQERPAPQVFKTSAAPFVWKPPLEKKTDYLPGEKISFSLVLFGNGTELLDIFIKTFKDFADTEKNGIKGKLLLKEVISENPLTGESEDVYKSRTGEIKTPSVLVKGEDLNNWGSDKAHLTRLSIHFLSQAFLKYRTKFFGELHFYYFFREILKRVLSLSYLYLNFKELDVDHYSLMENAKKVEKIRDFTFVEEEKSFIQEIPEEEKGLLGKVVFGGNISEFMPLLKMGEFVHVGEKTELGYGRYRIRDDFPSKRSYKKPGQKPVT